MYGAYLACVTTSSSRFEWLSLACAFLEQDIVSCTAWNSSSMSCVYRIVCTRKYVLYYVHVRACMWLYHAHGSFKLSSLRRQVYTHVDHFGNNSWQSSLRQGSTCRRILCECKSLHISRQLGVAIHSHA
jgi:hypothetical protein